MTRNQWIAIIVAIILILIAAAAGVTIWMRSKNKPMVGRAPRPINISSITPIKAGGQRKAGKAQTTKINQTPTLRTIRGRPSA